ncbi:MBL fold metallo-hydrolase [Candidatus Parcubacteria bacterium]|nr:MAG: MBL fold metallo-hydrolase [Candidatus Parcubacteria bacterium]
MNFEVDFLPVGTGSKGGDAATLRVWDQTGQYVFVIDGGTKDSGKALVSHIQQYYSTSTVNAVISTHPDGDHASGLTEVLENMDVRALVMHKPWDHAENIRHLFENRGLTTLGLQRKAREELEFVHELNKIAARKKVPVIEPFAGDIYLDGMIRVLGPSREHYQNMLPHYRTLPEAAESPTPTLGHILTTAVHAVEEAVEWVAETMEIETLTDEGGHFSAENSSSTVILFTLGTNKILFTGDADIDALMQAAACAASQGIALNDLHLLDVPHHGSKRNVGPTVLNLIKAEKAHISAPPDSPKHPAKKVINALIRRGSKVYTTQGKGVCYPSDGVTRPGWFAVEEMPFNASVEN